jgi:ribosomal protein L40E
VSAETIICRRCGVTNSSGDQFCGSCGAFLEWEGDEAPAAGQADPDSAQVAPPAPLPPEPETSTVRPPDAGPSPSTATPTPMPGFSVCPTCGSGNPPGRTFCHSCGNLLAREPSGTGAAGAGKAAADERRRGMPGWLPIVIGAGLVAGVAAVLVFVVFRPAGPPSAALPSSTLTPTLAVPPSVTAPPPSGVPSGVVPSGVAPSAPAGGSGQLTLGGATASSVSTDTPDVAAINVMDGRLDTRWQEAIGSEPGEWIEVTLTTSRLDYLVVYSGFQLSHDAFVATRRPQNVVLTVNGGAPAGFLLQDSELPQRIDVEDTPGATVVRIQIASTYPATASAYPGSPIDAATISEIRAFGIAGG